MAAGGDLVVSRAAMIALGERAACCTVGEVPGAAAQAAGSARILASALM